MSGQPFSDQADTGFVAEVIAIGDELTSGKRLDTNSQWLSQQLGDIGVRTLFHTTVADDALAMRQAFEIATRRVPVVLVTGGLGPTADDLTRQVIADLARVELVHHEPTLRHIRQLFESRGREMPDSNRIQARFPAGARVIPNLHGTAPGVDFEFAGEQQKSRLFALPGVPAEMKPMWADYVRPNIMESHPQPGVILHHSIHSFGLAESDVEARLPDIVRRGRTPVVGITASKATITLRISAAGQSVAECQELIAPTARLIRDELGDFVFGENGATLPHVVLDQLRDADRTLSIVDNGHCSLIADWLHDADPPGTSYLGTLSVAGNASLKELETIARSTFASDLVLLIGPTFEHSGTLHRDVRITSETGRVQSRFGASSNPSIVVQRSIKQALNFLRLSLDRQRI